MPNLPAGGTFVGGATPTPLVAVLLLLLVAVVGLVTVVVVVAGVGVGSCGDVVWFCPCIGACCPGCGCGCCCM